MSGIADLGGLSANSPQWYIPAVSLSEASTSLAPPRRHRFPQVRRPARQQVPEELEAP